MTPPKKTVRQQAEEHWDWIEQLLAYRLRETKHLFIESFIHGFKHGKESKGGQRGTRA